MECGDKLLAYRVGELIRLLEEVGLIEEASYEFVIRTLSHMEVGFDGDLKVIFLSGTEFVFNENNRKEKFLL
jgi:hypothetical protein